MPADLRYRRVARSRRAKLGRWNDLARGGSCYDGRQVKEALPMNRVGNLGALVWALQLALPLLGLWLLIAQPQFDVHWRRETIHFWFIAGFAGLNTALGAIMSEAARRRTDARLFLIAL